MIKFIHCADIHLDTPFTGLGKVNRQLQEKLLTASYKSFIKIIDMAIKKRVNFLLISGDLFDNSQKSLESQLRCKKHFERLNKEGISVFIVAGNHDPLTEPFKVEWPDKTYFFSEDKGETHFLEVDGCEVFIHGISYGKEKVTDNLVHLLPEPKGRGINIGLLHCEIATNSQYSPCSLTDLKNKNYDYFALGHIHQRGILSKSPYIVYSGCHQGKNIKETGNKGAYIVEIKDSLVETTFFETNLVQWINKEVDITRLSIDDLFIKLQDIVQTIEKEISCQGAVVRFTLVGKGELHNLSEIEINEMLHELNEEVITSEKYVWVESIVNTSSPAYDIGKIAEQNDFIATALDVYKNTIEDERLTEEMLNNLNILKNSTVRRVVGEFESTELISKANDKLIQMLIRG